VNTLQSRRAPISIDEYLAADFARFEAALIGRCMKIDGKRLYLTGASGFFGKNLLSLLADLQRRGASFHVTALSRDPELFLDNQAWCRGQSWLAWRTGDVSAPWPGEDAYDLLLHAATDTSSASHRDKARMFEGMLSGTRQALNFAAAHGIKRLLLAGSGAQYGAIPASYSQGVPESSSLACDSAKSASAYGEGKRFTETLAALHAEQHGFAVVNTRCFAFVGPGLPLNGHFAIGNFLRDALRGRQIRLSSDGSAVRSYLYGADLAVWLLILLLEAENGATINVGSDRGIRVVDLATRIRDLVNPTASVHAGDPRPGEERHHYLPNIDRARTLGLNVWTDLDQAITRTADWYRTDPICSQARGSACAHGCRDFS
jgi:nucleoside-diphosphate-sugar epimerase